MFSYGKTSFLLLNGAENPHPHLQTPELLHPVVVIFRAHCSTHHRDNA